MAHHHKYQYVDLSKSGYMSPSAFICGALREQYHLFHKEPEILEQKAHPELAKAHAKLNAIAQEKGGKVLSWVYIKDNIKCYKGGNTALPAYFDEHVVSTVMKHTPFVMQNLVHSDTSVTLGIGRLVHDILDVCEQHGPESKKLTLYSGHDTTLMPLLVALKFEDKYTKGFVPHYGDMIRVELRDNGKLQYVKLFYNDKLEREVSLEDFTQETAAFRLRSKQMWLQQCALTTHYDKPEDVPQFGYA
jgi:hypothetical protein